ncbi:MAG: hypothetical protein ACPF8V_10075, partial [Luteibaculum sp.]
MKNIFAILLLLAGYCAYSCDACSCGPGVSGFNFYPKTARWTFALNNQFQTWKINNQGELRRSNAVLSNSFFVAFVHKGFTYSAEAGLVQSWIGDSELSSFSGSRFGI